MAFLLLQFRNLEEVSLGVFSYRRLSKQLTETRDAIVGAVSAQSASYGNVVTVGSEYVEDANRLADTTIQTLVDRVPATSDLEERRRRLADMPRSALVDEFLTTWDGLQRYIVTKRGVEVSKSVTLSEQDLRDWYARYEAELSLFVALAVQLGRDPFDVTEDLLRKLVLLAQLSAAAADRKRSGRVLDLEDLPPDPPG